MTMATPPYDAIKDFTPIALVAKAPLAIAIRQDLPVNDVKGLIAYAKANPGNVSFAIGSPASAGHLSTELLKRSAGIDYLVVPYKGSGPAYQDLVGGRIDAFIDPILGSASHAKAGRLKVIAVTSKERLPGSPNVPTVGETHSGLRVLQLVRPVGSRKACPRRLPIEAERRSEQGAVRRNAREAHRARTAAHAGLYRRFCQVPAGGHGEGCQDHQRGEYPCGVDVNSRSASSSPARAPASARRSRRRYWPIGWGVIGFDIAPASIEHEFVHAGARGPDAMRPRQNRRRRVSDPCGRSFTPQACCA